MATPVVKRARPYRDFLTPALHRRFTSASLLALGVCYLDAVWMAEWGFIWQWLPFGYTGIRTSLLFISALVIFILRVSRTHAGTRGTTSPLETLWKELFDVTTYLTFVWYTLSAWVFSEVYIWGRPADAKLATTYPGRPHERGVKLNERAVAFRTIFLILGVVQSFRHLITDMDKVPYPLRKASADKKDKTPTSVDPPLTQISRALPIIGRNALIAGVFSVLPGIFIYILTPIRSIAWGWSYSLVKKWYTLNPAQQNHGPGVAPFFDFVLRLGSEVFLLVFLWETTNTTYSVYITQEPLKKDKPLTDDSKDPNGSLIVGLKAKKQFAKATAFWELVMITSRFPTRRQSIFEELDRTGGSTFSQILALSLAQISAINSRIAAYKAASSPAPPTPTPTDDVPARQQIAAPLKTDPIFESKAPPVTAEQKIAAWTTSVAKTHGNSPGAKPLKNALEFGSKKLLNDSQRAKLQPAAVQKEAEGFFMNIVKSPLGWFVRKPFSRRATSVICGAPWSEAGVICDAALAITILGKEALKEDKYARVSREIPSILLTFSSAIKAIDSFLKELQPHWSDTQFTEVSRSNVEEVNQVLDALKNGVGILLGVYGEYLPGLGMAEGQIGSVRSVAGSAGKEKAKLSLKGKEKVMEMEKI